MKKLLLIGNKPLDKDYSSIIDDYDMVVRVNRMLNYNQSKGKTDLWLADIHGEAFGLFKLEDKDKFIEAKKAITFPEHFKTSILYLNSINYKNEIVTLNFDSLNIKKWIPMYENKIGYRVTNVIWALIYCIEHFSVEYEIHTLGFSNRYFLNSNEHNWHNKIFKFEEVFAENLLSSGKIKSYDFDIEKEGYGKNNWELLKVIKHIPILIPIKEHSKRYPNKNKELLPFTLNWLKNIGRVNDAIVITDSDAFIDITEKYSISDYYIEKRNESQDELMSIYKYVSEKNIDKFIFLPVTQPLREKDLIDRIIESDLSKYNMAMSYNIYQDRSIYDINDNKFKTEGEKRGCMCQEKMSADGACYFLSKDFITKVVNSDKPNKEFWNSEVKFILNNMPQMDIDNEIDMKKLKNLISILK